MSTYTSVVISPETTTSPVFTSVSQATRPSGSSAMTASSTPSEIWSAILSGWPSVTDSDVNRNSLSDSCWVAMSPGRVQLRARLEVDHERHALEAVALAQPVLQEVRVVPRHQAAVVDLHREARRARLELRHVVHAKPLSTHGGRLARALGVAEEAVQLGGRDPVGRAVGERDRRGDEPLQPTPGQRGDRH